MVLEKLNLLNKKTVLVTTGLLLLGVSGYFITKRYCTGCPYYKSEQSKEKFVSFKTDLEESRETIQLEEESDNVREGEKESKEKSSEESSDISEEEKSE